MLSVLCNWIYVFITALALGFGISELAGRVLGISLKRLDSLVIAGLVGATVLAQVYSLLGPVGLAANGILILLSVVSLYYAREQVTLLGRKLFSLSGWRTKLVFIVLVIIWAFFTSRGYMHYDSDLYHAQSIRWMEEYGIVKGLGNFHERFAYNSSFFALSALYSMRFLCGTSMHTLSGFFALLLSGTCLQLGKKSFGKLSDYACVAAVYYLTTIVDEVVSPASDYSTMIVVFYIVIRFLQVMEEEHSGEELAKWQGLLCVLGVYAMTLKLTTGLLLLITILPVICFVQRKEGALIGTYLGIGLTVALPWLVRTVIISGYLIYPMPSLDVFSFDWKMNAENIALDAANIKAWGRAIYNAALVDMPLREWAPNWYYSTLSGTERLLIKGDLLSIFLLFVRSMIVIMKKKWDKLPILLLLWAVAGSYLFWQLSAPLLRYGYAYVLLLLALTVGDIIHSTKLSFMEVWIGAAFILYGMYKMFAIGQIAYGERLQPYMVHQQGYGLYEVEAYQIDGATFYYPTQGDRSGYDVFPAAPGPVEMQLRGDDIKDGFRQIK